MVRANNEKRIGQTREIWSSLVLSIGLLALAACSRGPGVEVRETSFGSAPDGESVTLYTLSGPNGVEVEIINFGGIIKSLKLPDADGEVADVVLGYDDLQGYIDDTNYFGALIGRFGNRIADARFEWRGEGYQLEANDNGNSLHSGSTGFHKKVWQAEPFTTEKSAGVRLTLVSPDGEGGYPGTLHTTAVYELNHKGELALTMTATTDKATPVSLTNHAYFNLQGSGPITDHQLQISAEAFTPVDEELIPTGELRPVQGTPFDFTEPKPIGRDLDADNQQLAYGRGYDHNWALNDYRPGELRHSATLKDPESGRVLTLLTDGPGLQFYSGNFLDGSTRGKNGEAYQHRTALCLEPQFFPDSPNQPGFSDTILRPGETYRQQIVYRFSAE